LDRAVLSAAGSLPGALGLEAKAPTGGSDMPIAALETTLAPLGFDVEPVGEANRLWKRFSGVLVTWAGISPRNRNRSSPRVHPAERMDHVRVESRATVVNLAL